MLSKAGFFDEIQNLRNETNRHFDLIGSRMVQTLWNLYTKCTRRAEFKAKAKSLLGW